MAVETALTLSCYDVAAVRHLLATPAWAHQRPVALAVAERGALAQYDRPLPTVTAYDQLLGTTVAGGVVVAGAVAGGAS